MSAQCEGCLQIYDDEDEVKTLLCNDCVEKAALYDITYLEKASLIRAALNSLAMLNSKTLDRDYVIGYARGILNTAITQIHDKHKWVEEGDGQIPPVSHQSSTKTPPPAGLE